MPEQESAVLVLTLRMTHKDKIYDAIIIGSGMGGMSSASMLARDGYSVLVLEAAHALGGCSSSYTRKGYTFESGATTLIGFDENQPMRILEDELGIEIPKMSLEPSMQVLLNGKIITRWKDQEKWIKEATKQFGEGSAQESFWKLAFDVSEVVWKVSGQNNFFPPAEITDWLKLLKNDPRDVWVLPYAFKSVRDVARSKGISNPEFYTFLDEQLMISAQAGSDETPFLFGAPASTYTNSTNYYVPGGLIEMVYTLRNYITQKGGVVKTRSRVVNFEKRDDMFVVTTKSKKGDFHSYKSKGVISNLPVWNMEEITNGAMANYFRNEAKKYEKAWGAFTMGIAFKNNIPSDVPLHNQIHLSKEDGTEGLYSGSIFVSLSHPDDDVRSPDGKRTMNVSTHAAPEFWFNLNGRYEEVKERVQDQIIHVIAKSIPGFSETDIEIAFSSTPVTWSNWVYRKKGRVGGIPQQMDRSLLDWTPCKTPFSGLYLAGDTVFPGQGIPGVTLGGINVYYRFNKHFKTIKIR